MNRTVQNLCIKTKPTTPNLYKDTYAINKLIQNHANSGNLDQACKLFETMPERNEHTYAFMIKAYSHNGRIHEAWKLFVEMPKHKIPETSETITEMVKNGKMKEAMKLFEGSSHKDVISWNAMVFGYVNNGEFDKARQLFDKMPAKHLFPWNAIVTEYAKNGIIDKARMIFDIIPMPVISCWNAMIQGYVKSGKIEAACQLFDKMPIKDSFSCSAMISGLSSVGRIGDARRVFDSIPNQDFVCYTSMIMGFARNRHIAAARQLFDQMPHRNLYSWNAMLSGYAQNELYEDGMKLFVDMVGRGIKVDDVTLVIVISACGNLALLDMGAMIHGFVCVSGLVPNMAVDNALCSMYAKCGDLRKSRRIFQSMKKWNVISWNTIITGYAHHGHGKEALGLFEEMKRCGTRVDEVTFLGALTACNYAGLVNRGRACFDAMLREPNLRPKCKHYACLVDLLSRAGHLDEAEGVVDGMPVEPSSSLWAALLGACRIHGNVPLAERAAQCLVKLQPHSPSTYVAMSAIYFSAGRYEDACRMKVAIMRMSSPKQPGCSWIEVSNKVHIFLKEDASHPQSDLIYKKLQELSVRMKEAGYVPDIYHSSFEAD